MTKDHKKANAKLVATIVFPARPRRGAALRGRLSWQTGAISVDLRNLGNLEAIAIRSQPIASRFIFESPHPHFLAFRERQVLGLPRPPFVTL